MLQKIKVGGLEYNILYRPVSEMPSGILGYANFEKQEIGINAEASIATQRVALWHETLHILSTAYTLKLEEDQVNMLTQVLLAFVSDNPTFTEDYVKNQT